MIFKFKSTEYGPISERLLSANLSDLCVRKSGVQTGPFGSQLHKEDYVGEGTPIITVEHLGDNRIAHENTPFVSDLDKERLTKYHLQEGDIVFSRVGSVDRRALVRKTEDGWLFSGRCLRVRVDEEKINPIYLSYFFGLESFKSYIRSIAVGATMPSLNTKILSDVPVYYPENLAEQECIAHLLYTLDEKIELNRQTNQTLEQMAQAIFKSWFVDFEPVKAKIAALEAGGCEDDALLVAMQAIAGSALFATDTTDADAQTQLARLQAEHPEQYATLRATAELFPSAMQESELGEIPEGWSVCQVENILERLKPVKRYTKKEVSSTGLVPVFEQGADILLGFHNEKAGFTADAKNPAFVFGDHTCITHLSCQDFDISQNVIPLRGRNRSTIWVYYAIQGKQAFQEYRRHWSELIVKPVIYPTRDICERYSETVLRMICFKESLERENRSLAELRDTLLPKLLSGEIDVSALADNTEVNA